MKISVGEDNIRIRAEHMNPEMRLNTEADIVEYNGRIYLSTPTGRYWYNSSRGNVIDLRNIYGKKLRSVGSEEILSWGTPVYWAMFEAEGRSVPLKVKTFYNKLKATWAYRR